MDVVSLATRSEDPKIRESLQLVRDRLGFHPQGLGQIADTQFIGSDQGVKDSQASVVGKDFENRR
jgi:hypothetical protein